MTEINRREALKRGAIVGASVLWVTPAVQGVSMLRSAAAAASPPPPRAKCFAVKIEEDGCEDIWDQIGSDTNPRAPQGHCLTPNAGDLAIMPGGCRAVRDFEAGDDGEDWTVTLAPGCEILNEKGYVMIKAGKECIASAPTSRNGQTWTFANPARNGKGISNIQFVICCEPKES